MSRSFSATFTVKANQAGIVYGRQGSFKSMVESECGVVITQNRGGDSRNPSFTITGKPGACDRARTMIQSQISAVISRAKHYRVHDHEHERETNSHPAGSAIRAGMATLKREFKSSSVNPFALLADDASADGVADVTTCLSKLAVGARKPTKTNQKGTKAAEKPKMTLDEYLAGQGKVVVEEDTTDKAPSAKRLRQMAKRGTTFSLHPKGRIGQLKFENWKAHMARLEAKAEAESPVAVAVEIPPSPPNKRTYDEAFNQEEDDYEKSDEETIAARPKLRARRSRTPETPKEQIQISWGDFAEDDEDERPSSTLNPLATTFIPRQ